LVQCQPTANSQQQAAWSDLALALNVFDLMPRLRRKTPHEPVRAVPSPAERGARALPRAPRSATSPLRDIALALNGGAPRPKRFDAELPELEPLASPEAPAPFRDRIEAREGRAELLVFRVGAELFATELRAVEEAVEGVDVRAIPDAGASLLGIFALRERTLPMYGLAHVLGVSSGDAPAMTLVMRPSAERIALAVDAVDDVFDVALADVRPTPASVDDGLVLGVVWRGDELLTLLDADAVVAACLACAPPDSL
jgi:purine-binding chemotaxis protein CheW